MTILRCSGWTVLVVAMLADVAPVPTSGGGCSGRTTGQENPTTYLEIRASNCSCAPQPILATIDDRQTVSMQCGNIPAVVGIAPGSHVVRAEMGDARWPPQTVEVAANARTAFELGCPQPGR